MRKRRAGWRTGALAALLVGLGAVATGLGGLAPAAAQQKAAAPAAAKNEGFQTAAPTAIIIDAEGGSVLFEKNADQPIAPASMAKVMTAELAFRALTEGKLSLTDEYEVSEYAWRKGGAPSGSATMFAALRSRIKVEDLIRGAVVVGGNDACIVLAEGMAGNEGSFVGLMNERARELGLTNTRYTNSTGLPDPDSRTTVRDLSILARHVIATYPQYYKYYAEQEFLWNKIRQQNRNPLLSMSIGADGLQTGATDDGGYGLVGSATQNGLRLIVALNGLKGSKERGEEAKRLFDWGFHNFEVRTVFPSGVTIGDAKVFGGDRSYVPLVSDGAVKLMTARGGNDRITARIVYSGPVRAPVTKGQPIGRLKIWRGETLALDLPLQAAADIGTGTLAGRAFDSLTELMVGLFRAGVEKL